MTKEKLEKNFQKLNKK